MADNSSLQNLADALIRGELFLILGADLVTYVGLPDWIGLIRPMAQTTGYDMPPDENLTSDHLLSAFQQFENRKERHELIHKIKEGLDTSKIKPSNCHRLLAQVVQSGASMIFTAFYDDVFEKALQEAGVKISRIVTEKDIPFRSSDQVSIIKLLGCPQQPGTLVITQTDFNNYSTRYPRLLEMLRSAIETKTALLLGFSPKDPFFKIFNPTWDTSTSHFKDLHRRSYAVMFDLSELEHDSWAKRTIEVINLETEKGKLRQQILENWLRSLIETSQNSQQNIPHTVPVTPIPSSTVRWLPNQFKYPPFAQKIADDDQHLSLYFLETADFARIQDPHSGTMFIFADAGCGKSALFRMVDEFCQTTLALSSGQQKILTVQFSRFDYLSQPDNFQQSTLDIHQLFEMIIAHIEKFLARFPPLKSSVGDRAKESLDYFRNCKDIRGTDLSKECDKVTFLLRELEIDYTYVLLDRIDEYNLEEETIVETIISFINNPTLRDYFQFKFFLPGEYHTLLSKRLGKRMARFPILTLKWKDSDLEKLLRRRLDKTTDSRISSFGELMDFPDPTLTFDVDQVIVKYAYHAPRDLIALADQIISLHMHDHEDAEQNLIDPMTFLKALQLFAKERAELLYGDDMIARISTISEYPISFEEIYRVMGSRFMERARKQGILSEETKPSKRKGRQSYTIPDPRVRLCCPACQEDQEILSRMKKEGEL